MSLQAYAERAIYKEGVYDLLWYFGKLVLVSLSDEDTNKGGGKAEGDLYTDKELTVLTPAMFSVVSGGVKTGLGETDKEAVQREVKQEVGLNLPRHAFKGLFLPTTRTIQQRKGNGTYDIWGVGYETEIDGVGLSVVEQTVRNQGGEIKVVTPDEARNLNSHESRPFLRTVLALLAEEKAASV